MTDSGSREGVVQIKPGTSCYTRKQKNYERVQGSHETDLAIHANGFPLP